MALFQIMHKGCDGYLPGHVGMSVAVCHEIDHRKERAAVNVLVAAHFGYGFVAEAYPYSEASHHLYQPVVVGYERGHLFRRGVMVFRFHKSDVYALCGWQTCGQAQSPLRLPP